MRKLGKGCAYRHDLVVLGFGLGGFTRWPAGGVVPLGRGFGFPCHFSLFFFLDKSRLELLVRICMSSRVGLSY